MATDLLQSQHHLYIGKPSSLSTERGDALKAERALVTRLAAGDAAALTETLATLWQPLVGYLVSTPHSRDEAEDFAQDTFARLWNHRAKLSAEGSVRGFVYRVAR